MPVKLQIDGGEQHLGYAKKRLALLQEQLLRQGLRTGSRHYQLADAHVEVHVSIPVDVGSGEPRPERAQNLVRIRGGDGATDYIYTRQGGYQRSVRLIPDSAVGDEVVSTGQRLLMQRLRYRAKPKAVKPGTEAHLLRSTSDACVTLAEHLPHTLERPSLVALNGRFFEGSYGLVNVREIDGRLRVLYQQVDYGEPEVGQPHRAFLADYYQLVRSLESWFGGEGPAVLTYRGTLATGVRAFTIGLGSYSYVHSLSFPDVPGEHAIEDTPNAPLEALDYEGYSDNPQELRLGVYSVTGSALVNEDRTAEIKLKVSFAVSPQFSLARIEAPVTLLDLKDLLSLPEEEDIQFSSEDSYSQVTVDYGYVPSFGTLVFTKSTNHVHEEQIFADDPDHPSLTDDRIINIRHSEEGPVYRLRIGAGGDLEVSEVPFVPWETYVESSIFWTGSFFHPWTAYSSESNRAGYPISPWAHGESLQIGEVAAHSISGQFAGLHQPLTFVTTSESTSTVYGIPCGKVDVYLVLDIFWRFLDPTTERWRVFLYEEELVDTDGIQGLLPGGGGDGTDGSVEYLNYEINRFEDYHGFEGQAEDFFHHDESRSVSVPDLPGGILSRGDETFHVDPRFPFGSALFAAALTLYWPQADGVRDGFCLLLFQETVSYAQFLDALRAALEIKADGGAYQSALQAAREMLIFMVNNFASWELIASFDGPGTYYIVAK